MDLVSERPVPVARGHHRRRRAGLGARPQRADARRARRATVRADARRGARGARHRRAHPIREAPRRVPVQLLARRRPTRAGCGGAPRWTAIATDDPDWDVLLDVDELARADDENWVWAGADVIEPDYTLALISLSRGGAGRDGRPRIRHGRHANSSPTASSCRKPNRACRGQNHDTVLVGTDFGAGSLTDSGYPRVVKRWRRGQPLDRRADACSRATPPTSASVAAVTGRRVTSGC